MELMRINVAENHSSPNNVFGIRDLRNLFPEIEVEIIRAEETGFNYFKISDRQRLIFLENMEYIANIYARNKQASNSRIKSCRAHPMCFFSTITKKNNNEWLVDHIDTLLFNIIDMLTAIEDGAAIGYVHDNEYEELVCMATHFVRIPRETEINLDDVLAKFVRVGAVTNFGEGLFTTEEDVVINLNNSTFWRTLIKPADSKLPETYTLSVRKYFDGAYHGLLSEESYQAFLENIDTLVQISIGNEIKCGSNLLIFPFNLLLTELNNHNCYLSFVGVRHETIVKRINYFAKQYIPMLLEKIKNGESTPVYYTTKKQLNELYIVAASCFKLGAFKELKNKDGSDFVLYDLIRLIDAHFVEF